MDNYKINAKDAVESKEAQELFFELGYEWYSHGKGIFVETTSGWIFAKASSKHLFCGSYIKEDVYHELTLPQLRDLAVLKCNSIDDATHADNYHDGSLRFYMTSDRDVYVYETNGFKRGWVKSGIYPKELTLITKPQDPSLISGAEAELVAQAKKFITSDHLNRFEAAEAHLEGHPVQFMLANGDFIDITSDTTLGIFEKDGGYSFRLKPQTIKVELELPKPFEPKLGDIYWFISPFYSTGYDHCTFTNDSADKLHVQYGAYRSEDDVKKAVGQLRKIRGAS